MQMLTKEEAYQLHIEMWEAMRKELGDNPTLEERVDFKRFWCFKKNVIVYNDCFLCEYAHKVSGLRSSDPDAGVEMCSKYCPVVWGDSTEVCCCEAEGNVCWSKSNLNDILALPKRESAQFDERKGAVC